jgi:transposase
MRFEKETEKIRWKYKQLKGVLNERGRRHWAGTEALSIGRGGIRAVVVATGLATNTVRTGIKEIKAKRDTDSQEKGVRRKGGGRKRLVEKNSALMTDLDHLVDPITRGTEKLAQALREKGYKISADTVGRLLKKENYSLQSNRKRHEGKQHPDRDAQFHYISERVTCFQAENQPVISVDTKKKELIGNFKNAGIDWQKKRGSSRSQCV